MVIAHLKNIVQNADPRNREYAIVERFFQGAASILDAGCGTGTFLARDPAKRIGIDYNPENVAWCNERGLSATTGDVRAIHHPDASFDAVYCSHVLQVFESSDMEKSVRELIRVTRPNGVVAISTLNWFADFWRHPENARPYPPNAIARLFVTRGNAVSPMNAEMPRVHIEHIARRYLPLINFPEVMSTSLYARVFNALNLLQRQYYMVRFWSYDAYIIILRKAA